MKRDGFLGQDPERKIIFAFLFSKNQKVLSLFIQYSDENTLQIAKQTIALHIIFWHSGGSAAHLKEVFEHDPSLVSSGMKFWTECVK
ncbi:hypothetical protein E0H80_09540 [Acinetobacter sp. ANC 4779]|uniref:hypothetical protein n=1 Tax=Acinetobacter sp. ANC 4779 TaxID=2529848 RepID=UPI00103C3A4A|nr:hypothetical protein [Acinetobacter sp. ANC 4779]TCB50067.1 hypothetical protein E0H80_09540 [Acinetobacter sp. ANC 4779]